MSDQLFMAWFSGLLTGACVATLGAVVGYIIVTRMRGKL